MLDSYMLETTLIILILNNIFYDYTVEFRISLKDILFGYI